MNQLKLLITGCSLLWPASTFGQGAPGTRLTVDITVSSVAMTGDTVRIEYTLANRADSEESVFTYTVDAPSPVIQIFTPEPVANWSAATLYRDRSVADWAVLGSSELRPGEQGPPLWFRAVGLPTIVSAWVMGYFPPPPLPEFHPDSVPPDTPEPAVDPLISNSVAVRTVGVGPIPSQSDHAALVTRLRGLLAETCGELGWISEQGICTSLRVKLDAAAESLDRGQPTAAAQQLGAFLHELEAQRGQHINDSAYFLLHANAEFIVAGLETPSP